MLPHAPTHRTIYYNPREHRGGVEVKTVALLYVAMFRDTTSRMPVAHMRPNINSCLQYSSMFLLRCLP